MGSFASIFQPDPVVSGLVLFITNYNGFKVEYDDGDITNNNISISTNNFRSINSFNFPSELEKVKKELRETKSEWIKIKRVAEPGYYDTNSGQKKPYRSVLVKGPIHIKNCTVKYKDGPDAEMKDIDVYFAVTNTLDPFLKS
jgi:hypothetical protein